MILHIYHCSLAVISDKKKSKGRANRPAGIIQYPAKRGQANIDSKPSTDGFADSDIRKILTEFESMDIFKLEGSPIEIKWDALAKKLGMDNAKLRKLLAQVYNMGLLRRLTIDYNYEKWMKHSNVKGCLVVMTCIENKDYEREGLVDAFFDEVVTIRQNIISKDQILDTVIIVPNTHLTEPGRLGQRWDKNVELLERLKQKFIGKGFTVQLASFGYAKTLHLVIHGHKLGYVYRSI